MYSIGSDEIHAGWRYAWDCLVEACYDDVELMEILRKYKSLPETNHIKVVNSLVNHFFTDDSIRLVAMWGFGDTPANDQMYLDIKAKLDKVKPYLENYLT